LMRSYFNWSWSWTDWFIVNNIFKLS
jgi:hypothetical protein